MIVKIDNSRLIRLLACLQSAREQHHREAVRLAQMQDDAFWYTRGEMNKQELLCDFWSEAKRDWFDMVCKEKNDIIDEVSGAIGGQPGGVR